MNCLRCNTPNEEGAKFCKNCGMDMSYTPSNESTNSKIADTLLFIYIGVAFFSIIVEFVFLRLLNLWSYIWLIRILASLSLILIPLSIKNKTMKIIGLITIILIVIYQIFMVSSYYF